MLSFRLIPNTSVQLTFCEESPGHARVLLTPLILAAKETGEVAQIPIPDANRSSSFPRLVTRLCEQEIHYLNLCQSVSLTATLVFTGVTNSFTAVIERLSYDMLDSSTSYISACHLLRISTVRGRPFTRPVSVQRRNTFTDNTPIMKE